MRASPRIPRDTMLQRMGADRIARANGLTQYRMPGMAGYHYDPAEAA